MESFRDLPDEARIPVIMNIVDSNAVRISNIESSCVGQVLRSEVKNIKEKQKDFKSTVDDIYDKIDELGVVMSKIFDRVSEKISEVNFKFAIIVGIAIALQALISVAAIVYGN